MNISNQKTKWRAFAKALRETAFNRKLFQWASHPHGPLIRSLDSSLNCTWKTPTRGYLWKLQMLADQCEIFATHGTLLLLYQVRVNDQLVGEVATLTELTGLIKAHKGCTREYARGQARTAQYASRHIIFGSPLIEIEPILQLALPSTGARHAS